MNEDPTNTNQQEGGSSGSGVVEEKQQSEQQDNEELSSEKIATTSTTTAVPAFPTNLTPLSDEFSQLTDQFVSYLNLEEISSNGVKQTEKTAEAVMTRLDEFGEHLDYIHSNTSNVSGKVLPQLLLVAKNVELLFKKIDSVKEYVHFVHKKVHDLDNKLTELEKQESNASLKKFLPKFLGGQQQAPQHFSFVSTDYFVDPSILKSNIQRLGLVSPTSGSSTPTTPPVIPRAILEQKPPVVTTKTAQQEVSPVAPVVATAASTSVEQPAAQVATAKPPAPTPAPVPVVVPSPAPVTVVSEGGYGEIEGEVAEGEDDEEEDEEEEEEEDE